MKNEYLIALFISIFMFMETIFASDGEDGLDCYSTGTYTETSYNSEDDLDCYSTGTYTTTTGTYTTTTGAYTIENFHLQEKQEKENFLKGVLIYRPQEGSDQGIIQLPIMNLNNPLEGTFDLSQCDDVGKYLKISTGFRKEKNWKDTKTLEISLIPRFLIREKWDTTAYRYQKIYNFWKRKAEVGIFWYWQQWEDTGVDYLITKDIHSLSQLTLHDLYSYANGADGRPPRKQFIPNAVRDIMTISSTCDLLQKFQVIWPQNVE